MTKGARTIFDHAFAPKEDHKSSILLLPENHTLTGPQIFVESFAGEMAKNRDVRTHFLETPYWFNPILKAHFEGDIGDDALRKHIKTTLTAPYITDAMKNLWADKIIASHKEKILSVGLDVRSLDSLFWDDGMMKALAQKQPGDLTDKQSLLLEAWNFKQKYPESVKYHGIAVYLKNEGVPEDSIHGALASLVIEDRGGNAIMTYGERHILGADHDKVQGIIDDVLEQRGLQVTTAVIATSENDMRRQDALRYQFALSDKSKGREYARDTQDFRYVIESDSLQTQADLKLKDHYDFFEPFADGKALAEAFNKPHQYDMTQNEKFELLVKRARENAPEVHPIPSMPESQPVQH